MPGLLGALTAPLLVLTVPVQDELRVQPDGYAQVQGVVLDNIRGWARPALRAAVACARTGEGEGEGEARCPDALVRRGLAIAPGTPVRAAGRMSFSFEARPFRWRGT